MYACVCVDFSLYTWIYRGGGEREESECSVSGAVTYRVVVLDAAVWLALEGAGRRE